MLSVSAIVPAHDAGGFVEDAVRSALSQTVRDLEVVCVDDGSTDDTAAVLHRLASEDGRVRVVSSGGRGSAAARNRGVASSRAPVLAFLDADDLWHAEKLERQLPVLAADEGVGFVCADFERVPFAGGVAERFDVRPYAVARDRFRALLARLYVHTSTVVMRRTDYEAAGGMDEALVCAHDRAFFLEVGRRKRIEIVPDVLATVRTRDESLTGRLEDVGYPEDVRVYERVLAEYTLDAAERLAAEELLSDRLRRLASRALRDGSGVVAREYLERLATLRPADPALRRLPLSRLPGWVLRALGRSRRPA